MQDAAQLDNLIGWQIQFQQAGKLCVAILYHHIDALMGSDEVMNFMREGICPDSHVIHIDTVFLPDLVEALAEREVSGSVCQETNPRCAILHYNRGWNQ